MNYKTNASESITITRDDYGNILYALACKRNEYEYDKKNQDLHEDFKQTHEKLMSYMYSCSPNRRYWDISPNNQKHRSN